MGYRQFGTVITDRTGQVLPREAYNRLPIEPSIMLQSTIPDGKIEIQSQKPLGNHLIAEITSLIYRILESIEILQNINAAGPNSLISGQNLAKLTLPLDSEGPITIERTSNLDKNIELDFVPKCTCTEATVHSISGQISTILTPPVIPENLKPLERHPLYPNPSKILHWNSSQMAQITRQQNQHFLGRLISWGHYQG